MKKLPVPAKFDWDKGNIEKNWEKHKVHYKEAEEVFFDEGIKIFQDIKHSQTEDRFAALGQTRNKRKLHLSFTIRYGKIRVISARNQSKKERRSYEKK